jgi:hypothetical protein
MEKAYSQKTTFKAFLYGVLVIQALLLLWFSPQPAWVKNSQVFIFSDILFKIAILAGLADCGFKVFSTKETRQDSVQRAWVMLIILCFMAFAKIFLVKGLILIAS